jgi:hypothetical protein
MDKGDKINAIATIFLAIIIGVSQLYLAWQNNELNNKLYQLQASSVRADISILVNPSQQNWAFTSDNGTAFTINGLLVNEGSRSAEILSIGASATYDYSPNGRAGNLTMSINSTNLERSFLPSKESTKFAISGTTRPYAMFELMQLFNVTVSPTLSIASPKPSAIEFFVTYNDGESIQVSRFVLS